METISETAASVAGDILNGNRSDARATIDALTAPEACAVGVAIMADGTYSESERESILRALTFEVRERAGGWGQ